jgi:scyllo-inositol 2-dehydrogenase (NADP+)
MPRVALIGFGLAGAVFHAPLIEAVEGLDLVVVVTRDAERRDRVRREFPAAELLESADEVWQRSGELDLVVIAAPNRLHVPLARAAIEAGLAVVVDKPFAATAAEARELVDVARDRAALVTVFQNRRWDGDFLTVRRLLEAGDLGDVVRFESRFERWRPALRGGWRESGAAEEAGGLLYDLGSHLVDQALQLFGSADTVYAELDARRPGAEVDDDAFVAITHASGVRSHLWMTALAAQPAARFRVLGDRAGYVKHGLDVQEEQLAGGIRPGDAKWGVEPEDDWGTLGAGDDVAATETERGAYQRFYELVVPWLAGEGPPPVEPREAVEALEVLDAARESAAAGRVIRSFASSRP